MVVVVSPVLRHQWSGAALGGRSVGDEDKVKLEVNGEEKREMKCRKKRLGKKKKKERRRVKETNMEENIDDSVKRGERGTWEVGGRWKKVDGYKHS